MDLTAINNTYNTKVKKVRTEKQLFRLKINHKRYNITFNEYLCLKKKQKNKCAICKKEQENKSLTIDHDHITGKIRGLLCFRCNLGLGNFYDKSDLLLKARRYLKMYK